MRNKNIGGMFVQEEFNGKTAKERYDQKNPIISVRISAKEKKSLTEAARLSGKSINRLIREGVTLEISKSDSSYHRGFADGYKRARDLYGLKIQCEGCGKDEAIKDEDSKSIILDVLAKACGCYHKDCIPIPDPKRVYFIIEREKMKVYRGKHEG